MLLVVLLAAITIKAAAQKSDTIIITEKNINTKVLKEGTHRYLVYFKLKKDATRTMTQFWTRTIQRGMQDGKPVLTVTQEWEDKDTVVHTVRSVCDAVTMKTITHEYWWKQRGSIAVDMKTRTLTQNDLVITANDTARQRKMIMAAFATVGDNYFLNWHLDLEVFPTLPYKKGVTFMVPYYDPGTSAPFQKVAYTVTGSAELQGYDYKKIDCWLLLHESKGNREVFWISKKTREVLKLEQEINGTTQRFKIKLGFSN